MVSICRTSAGPRSGLHTYSAPRSSSRQHDSWVTRSTSTAESAKHQISPHERKNRLLQVVQERRIADAVLLLRIELHLERHLRLLELVNELHGVLRVDVVVDRAVDQQQVAVPLPRRP